MAKKYVCSECGYEYTKSHIDWECSDESEESFLCEDCAESLARAGRNAMDPDGNGYDEDGYWDEEYLGF